MSRWDAPAAICLIATSSRNNVPLNTTPNEPWPICLPIIKSRMFMSHCSVCVRLILLIFCSASFVATAAAFAAAAMFFSSCSCSSEVASRCERSSRLDTAAAPESEGRSRMAARRGILFSSSSFFSLIYIRFEIDCITQNIFAAGELVTRIFVM